MKVHKSSSRSKNEQRSASRRHAKSKWRLNSKKQRASNPSRLSPSPSTAKLQKQIVRSIQKPKLKRLQKSYAKAVTLSPEAGHPVKNKGKAVAAATVTLPHAHTNGGPELVIDSESEDSENWITYAKSILQNGIETKGEGAKDKVPAEEGEAVEYHSQHDPVQNHTILLLKQGQSLCFRGKCLLTCLSGRVEVLGFTIEQGQQPYPLFSPPSHCPLSITAIGECSHSARNRKEGRLEAKAIIRKHLTSAEPRKRLLNEVDSDSCVLLLQPLDTPLTRYLSSFSQYHQLFGLSSKELRAQASVYNPALSAVGVTALRGQCGRGLVSSSSYKDALVSLQSAWEGDFERCPIILVCGGKNSGKSTFNRHLINSLLNHTASVQYLECDLGQTEFTPPGCLSLSTVTEPLLGPPFTHQREADHMVFYGQAECQADLDRYLDSLKSLWRHYSGESPLVINTMGWVKGHGFQVLVDLIRFFSITHVVQLSYGDTQQCPSLTPEFLRSAHGWQTHPPAQPALAEEPLEHLAARSHVLLSVHSEFEGAGVSGELRHQRSNELRDLALLAYLSQLQSVEPGPVRPLHSFTPYQVPHSAAAIGVTHCEVAPNHILYAANASLVGLCCLGEKVASRGGPVLLSQTPICQCVGLGVLRGVDMTRGLYFLITPVHPSALRQVNCLLLGEITLPKILLTIQDGVETELPYVTTDYSFDITGAGKVHVFKGLARPSFAKSKMNN